MMSSDALRSAQERYDAKCPSISVRLLDVLPEVEARTPTEGKKGETIRRDLRRYYALMRAEVATIGLSRHELKAVLDACRGMFVDESAEVDGAYIRGKVADRGATNTTMDKLRSMTPAQTYALADLICMYSVQEQGADEFLRGLGYE